MIFTDMDGVVAVYDRNGFIEDKDGNMPFMEPGIHYFESRDPDTRIIDAYELISKDHQFFVLSNIVDDPTVSEEHESDKKKWVKKHMPFVDTDDQLLVIKEPKYKAAERLLNRKLEITDVLISDFKNDIIPWVEAGGTAIKYLNGINDPNSYSGPQIAPEMDAKEIARYVGFFAA